MNPDRPFSILFLCTGNSARSIFAEYLIRKLGKGRFQSFSAGANPKPAVNPCAVRVLRESFGLDVSDARSKSWDEYRNAAFDFVITLCDNARETCPVWPGQPIIAHWPSPDPAEFKGDEQGTHDHFWKVAMQIHRRIDLFCNLPLEKLDRIRLEQQTKEIGQREIAI